MRLRAVVADGQVWGFGDTDERALKDAEDQFHILTADPAVDQATAPTGEFTFHDITLEEAKRVADGDRTWRVEVSR